MTHRQYLAWLEWLRGEWNSPDRSDYYLMQIATEVRRGNVKRPRQVRLKHLRLEFKSEEQRSSTPSPSASSGSSLSGSCSSTTTQPNANFVAYVTAVSKARWVSAMGMGIRIRNADGTLTEPMQVKRADRKSRRRKR